MKLNTQLFNDDCMNVMRAMPDGGIDLIVTSPPYNLRNSTGNGMKDGRGGRWKNAALLNGYSHSTDDMPHAEYVAWQRECLTEMYRLLSPAGAIFYNHKWRVQDGLIQDRQDIVTGFPVRQIIIWKRNGGVNFTDSFFLPTYEVIYLIAKPDFRLLPKANGHGDIWTFAQERDNPHPAPFPIGLPKRCIASTTAKVIFDPFLGSGTTGLAAIALNRDFIGCEISPDYYAMAQRRIEAAQSQGMFEMVTQP